MSPATRSHLLPTHLSSSRPSVAVNKKPDGGALTRPFSHTLPPLLQTGRRTVATLIRSVQPRASPRRPTLGPTGSLWRKRKPPARIAPGVPKRKSPRAGTLARLAGATRAQVALFSTKRQPAGGLGGARPPPPIAATLGGARLIGRLSGGGGSRGKI
jgi:hypothetical protein